LSSEGNGHLEMQAVSKRAQASVGLAYHHFGSKAGLIAAVVEAFYSRLDEVVFKDAKSPSEGWADREKRRIASYVAFHYDHPFAPLVIGALSRDPKSWMLRQPSPTDSLLPARLCSRRPSVTASFPTTSILISPLR
jgi:AcrR family transcriptional regulator